MLASLTYVLKKKKKKCEPQKRSFSRVVGAEKGKQEAGVKVMCNGDCEGSSHTY